MTTLTRTQNRYRTLRTDFLQFPCKVDNLVIESYTKINGKSRLGALDIFLFDSITWKATRGEYFQALGFNGKELYQLVLKEEV